MVTNIYVTLAEAEQFILMYKGTSGVEAWSALSDENKQAYLFRAMLLIDRLPFLGVKADLAQTEQFPRIINGINVGIPDDIKLAVVLQAYEAINEDGEVKRISQFGKNGITSYRIDDYSVSFDTSKNETTEMLINPLAGITSEALMLLKPYLRLGGACHVL